MDNLVERLQYTSLKEKFTFRLIPQNISSKQKCIISKNLMKDLNIHCSDYVKIQTIERIFICKVFKDDYNINDCIKIVPTVYQSTSGHTIPGTECAIEKFEHSKNITYLEVDLVWDNYILDVPPKVLQSILKFMIIGPDCIINIRGWQIPALKCLCKIIIVNCKPYTFGTISHKTQIMIRNILTVEHFKQQKTTVDFFGMTTILNLFLELVEMNKIFQTKKQKLFRPINQILLAGPIGCGKTTLVHKVASLKNLMLLCVRGQSVYQRDPGEAEKSLSALFDKAFVYAKNNEGCILLIEDIDSLCPNPRNMSQHTRRLSTLLMQLLESCSTVDGLIIVATTNSPSDVNPALRRQGRLAKEIYFAKPSRLERAELVRGYMNKLLHDVDFGLAEEISENIADVSQGYVAADLKSVCQSFYLKYMKAKDKGIASMLALCKQVLLGHKPLTMRGDVDVVAPGQGGGDVGGLDDVKRQLQLVVDCMLVYPDVYRRFGLLKTKGVLLYGPPGCAKTSLVRGLAARGRVTVLTATAAALYSPYVGDAERAVLRLFDKARQNAPAIIFLDEIDSIIGSRSQNNASDVQTRVLSALLTEMDGIGVSMKVADYRKKDPDGDDILVIAATNRPNEIDAALLRPGRFDRHIYVPPPDSETRRKILEVITKDTPLDHVDFEEIAKKTEGCSGADLKSLHTEVVLKAMTEEGVDVPVIRQKHYNSVLENFKSSLDISSLEKYKNIL